MSNAGLNIELVTLGTTDKQQYRSTPTSRTLPRLRTMRTGGGGDSTRGGGGGGGRGVAVTPPPPYDQLSPHFIHLEGAAQSSGNEDALFHLKKAKMAMISAHASVRARQADLRGFL